MAKVGQTKWRKISQKEISNSIKDILVEVEKVKRFLLAVAFLDSISCNTSSKVSSNVH